MEPTSFLFLCAFGATVTWFLLSYDNPSNAQFVLLLCAFSMFLWYISSYKTPMSKKEREHFVVVEVEEEEAQGSIVPETLKKWVALPTAIKNTLTPEIDQMINVYKGMKDPEGKDPDEIYLDENMFKQLKDPTVMSGDTVDAEKMKKIQEDYYLIDKLFRDLRINNPELYLKAVFLPGKELVPKQTA